MCEQQGKKPNGANEKHQQPLPLDKGASSKLTLNKVVLIGEQQQQPFSHIFSSIIVYDELKWKCFSQNDTELFIEIFGA